MKKFFAAVLMAAMLAMVSTVDAATITYFDEFETEVHGGLIDMRTIANGGDSFKIALCTGAPTKTWTQYSSLTSELATASGYTATGAAMVTTSLSQTNEVMTWVGTDVTWTLSAQITFRYAVLYNSTTGHLVGWWDFTTNQTPSSSLTLTITTLLTVSTAQLDLYDYLDFVVIQNDAINLDLQMAGDVEIFREAA